MTNSHAWKMLPVRKAMGACPCCDYWWGQKLVKKDCNRCGGNGLDVPVPPGDMIK